MDSDTISLFSSRKRKRIEKKKKYKINGEPPVNKKRENRCSASSVPLLLLDEFNKFMKENVPTWNLNEKGARFMDRIAAIYRCGFNTPKLRFDYRTVKSEMEGGGVTDFETHCPITGEELKNQTSSGHNYQCEDFPPFFFRARICCERQGSEEQHVQIRQFLNKQLNQIRYELGPWVQLPLHLTEKENDLKGIEIETNIPIHRVVLEYSKEKKKFCAMVSSSWWSGPYLDLDEWMEHAKNVHISRTQVVKYLKQFIPSDSIGGSWMFKTYFSLPSDMDDSNGKCITCLTAKANMVVIECGHMCVCEKCSEQILQTCPMCRLKFQPGGIRRVFSV